MTSMTYLVFSGCRVRGVWNRLTSVVGNVTVRRLVRQLQTGVDSVVAGVQMRCQDLDVRLLRVALVGIEPARRSSVMFYSPHDTTRALTHPWQTPATSDAIAVVLNVPYKMFVSFVWMHALGTVLPFFVPPVTFSVR